MTRGIQDVRLRLIGYGTCCANIVDMLRAGAAQTFRRVGVNEHLYFVLYDATP